MLSETELRVTECRICGAPTGSLGPVHGAFSKRDYELRRCVNCRYSFIADPWTEFEKIYDSDYYRGEGADPLVDYQFELDDPDRTIRRYEWHGITEVVEKLLGGLAGVRWLDFGCGNGALVRYLLANTTVDAYGYDAYTEKAANAGMPILTSLDGHEGQFDVVTAIEVIEHTLDPLAELRRIRQVLRPGGLVFFTTGNAAPFEARLQQWSYVIPEVHISYFEPVTLEYALRAAGFRPEVVDMGRGFDEILKFKVLKVLKLRRRNPLTDLIPNIPVATLADWRRQLSKHPVGWAE